DGEQWGRHLGGAQSSDRIWRATGRFLWTADARAGTTDRSVYADGDDGATWRSDAELPVGVWRRRDEHPADAHTHIYGDGVVPGGAMGDERGRRKPGEPGRIYPGGSLCTVFAGGEQGGVAVGNTALVPCLPSRGRQGSRMGKSYGWRSERRHRISP